MSTRFAVGSHILTSLSFHEEDGSVVSSAQLAQSVGTSAAVVRQISMLLVEAGLIKTRMGPGGGSMLARAAEEITLRQVWEATEREEVIATHRCEPGQSCLVGRHILSVLEQTISRAQEAMLSELEQVSIAELRTAVREEERAARARCCSKS